MDFLDNLILGANTPSYSDIASFPSKTFKKNICRKKHCDKFCVKDSGGNWEFWARTLTCKPFNRFELINKIQDLPGCLRFSVWNKISFQEVGKTVTGVIQTKELQRRDQLMLDLILEKNKTTNFDEEEVLNTIISAFSEEYLDLELLIELVYLILNLPFSNLIYLENILKFLNIKLKIHELLRPKQAQPPEKDYTEGEDPPDKTDLSRIEDEFVYQLFEFLIRNDFHFFCKILDLLFCFRNCTIKEALEFLIDKNDVNNFDTITSISNLNKLKEHLLNKQNNLKEEEKSFKPTESTYYDFLVVQNETIKAQEHIKNEFVKRIDELEIKNIELENSLNHFKEVSITLEQELTNYQDEYVKDITKMLDEAKSQNDELLKDMLKLKEENCRLKRNAE